MKMIRLIKADNIEQKLEDIINKNLSYEGYDLDDGMINPSYLLKKYEDQYDAIRPKNIDYGKDGENSYSIKYISQGCDDPEAMFNMIREAISQDSELSKMYDEGYLKIQVCSRDNLGQWTTFNNKVKDQIDIDKLIEDAEYLEDNDDSIIYELAEAIGTRYDAFDNIAEMVKYNPEAAEKVIRKYIN